MKQKLKEFFATPQKNAVTIACILVILATAGTCIVYAAGAFTQPTADAIGREDAQRFAFADAGVDPVEAKAVHVKYERWQGTFVYEVEFIAGDTEYEYKIDAADGSVVKKESKTVIGPEATSPPQNSITLEEAREIALADAGLAREDVTFTNVEQDTEGGVPVYEFEFYGSGVEYEYEINAQTGAIYSKSMVTYVGQGSVSPTPPPAQTNPPARTDPPAQSTAPAPTARPTAPQPSSGFTPPEPPTPPASQSQQPSSQSKITADQAKSAALADAGLSASDVQYIKAELDRENGTWVYEVEFQTSTHEYEYEINAHTGAVYSKSVEAFSTSGGRHDDPHHSGSTLIGASEARAACLHHAGCSADQVTFTKVELESDDGLTVYEVEFRCGGVKYEYTIDAVTGDVLEYEWET